MYLQDVSQDITDVQLFFRMEIETHNPPRCLNQLFSSLVKRKTYLWGFSLGTPSPTISNEKNAAKMRKTNYYSDREFDFELFYSCKNFDRNTFKGTINSWVFAWDALFQNEVSGMKKNVICPSMNGN